MKSFVMCCLVVCVLLTVLWPCPAYAKILNPSSMISPVLADRSACTREEANIVARYFHQLRFDGTNCPKEDWMSKLAAADDHSDKVFIDIGFNKGYNFANWLKIWKPSLKVNNKLWGEAIKTVSGQEDCGNCLDCVSNNAPPLSTMDTNITMIGLDLNGYNVQLVENITENIKQNLGFDLSSVLFVMHAAVSNMTGTISVLDCSTGSWEGCLILPTALSGGIKVPVYKVDDLVQLLIRNSIIGTSKGRDKHSMMHGHRTHSVVDLLLIDTEGSDPLVLQGAAHLLRSKLVRIVVFEYHIKCPWPLFPLNDVIEDLHRSSYTCYFDGQGRLYRLTGCWDPLMEIHEWANIICVRNGDPWAAILESYRVTPEYAKRELEKANVLDKVFPLRPIPAEYQKCEI